MPNTEKLTLKNKTKQGEPLEVTYLPGQGMNMISFKKGEIEVIDPSTKPLFDERYSGLGPLIGPHFHNRKPNVIPKIKDESLFPHIATVRAQGRPDPFSHGIGRYAPWKVEATETKVIATLTGKDEWQGIPLADLEGQNFKMTFESELTATGLQLNLSVTSDSDSVVGIHYYYRLPQGVGRFISHVQDKYIINNQKQPIPQEWNYNAQHLLTYEFNQPTDFTFHPFPNPREGKILLDTPEYQLLTTYTCASQENSFQVYHPSEASFACIEPISSQDPRHTNLSVSGLSIHLQILDPKEYDLTHL